MGINSQGPAFDAFPHRFAIEPSAATVVGADKQRAHPVRRRFHLRIGIGHGGFGVTKDGVQVHTACLAFVGLPRKGVQIGQGARAFQRLSALFLKVVHLKAGHMDIVLQFHIAPIQGDGAKQLPRLQIIILGQNSHRKGEENSHHNR